MSIKVWGCNVQEVGKALKMSKKLYTWKFSIDGKEQVVELVTSFLTGKKKVTLNGSVIYEAQTIFQNKKLQFDFKIGSTTIWLFQNDSGFDMHINNDLFSVLWEKEMARKQYGVQESRAEEANTAAGLSVYQQAMGRERKSLQNDSKNKDFDNVWGDLERKRTQTQVKSPSKPADMLMSAGVFEKQDCSGVKIVFLDDSHFTRKIADFEKHHNIYSREYRERPPKVVKEEEVKPKNLAPKQPKQDTTLFGQFGGWEGQKGNEQKIEPQSSFKEFFDFGKATVTIQGNKDDFTRTTQSIPQKVPQKNPLFEDPPLFENPPQKPAEKKPQANLMDLLDMDSGPSGNVNKPDNGFLWGESSTTTNSIAFTGSTSFPQKQGFENETKPKNTPDLSSALGEIFANTPTSTEIKIATSTTQTNTAQTQPQQQATQDQKPKKTGDLWSNDLVDLSDLKGNNQGSTGMNDLSYGIPTMTNSQYTSFNPGFNQGGFNQGNFQYNANNQNLNSGNYFGGGGANFQVQQNINNYGKNTGQNQPFTF